MHRFSCPFRNLGLSLARPYLVLQLGLPYVILKAQNRYALTRTATRDIIKSIFAGIALTLLIVLTRRLLPGRLLAPLIISAFLTIAVYGIVFKSYYRKLLRRG